MHRLPGAERFEEGHHLPLVVHRPARDHALAMRAVHDGGLEGRALPKFQRLRRLHVVMAVIEKVRRVGAFGFVMGQQNGMPLRGVKLSREAQRPELVPQPGASAFHLVLVGGIGRNRRDAQEVDIARNSRAEIALDLRQNGLQLRHAMLQIKKDPLILSFSLGEKGRPTPAAEVQGSSLPWEETE